MEIFCEDCNLAALVGFYRGFGPRFRVHQFKSARPAKDFLFAFLHITQFSMITPHVLERTS